MAELFEGTAYPLRKALLAEYGSLDRRVKKIEKISRFRVDECEMLKGADGNPLSHVCTIYVDVPNDEEIKVALYGNVPIEGPVEEWTKAQHFEGGREGSYSLSFALRKGEQDKLSSLAQAMRGVVVGRRYSVPSYMYTCPRTADGLDHLKRVLDEVWNEPKNKN